MSQKRMLHSWREAWQAWARPQIATMLFLGFSAGVPLLLIFSSLSLWLNEAGIETAEVTLFSWAALGYSFKFVWAPVIDKLPLPILAGRLGQRRSWLLLAQIAIIAAIIWMAMTNPAGSAEQLTVMAMAAVMLGFSAATQDIVIDAYRIEAVECELQAMMSASYIAGYRVGMLVAGAGALFIASMFGSSKESYSYQAWMWTYFAMAAVMLVGVLTTLVIREPDTSASKSRYLHGLREYIRFLLLFVLMVAGLILTYFYSGSAATALKQWLAGNLLYPHMATFLVEGGRLFVSAGVALLVGRMAVALHIANREVLRETYIAPVKDFFQRYGLRTAWILLLLIGFYRISDIVLGVISNVFYQDMGFSKNEIAGVTKTFGLLMILVGGFIGGTLTVRYGVMRMLFIGALLSAGTNILFLLLAQLGHDMPVLMLVIAADNISGGLASAAFVAFLSSLTNISFTAMQYAIFSSLMTLFPKLLGGYSGGIVDALGYGQFFILTAMIGVPVMILVWYSGRLLQRSGGSAQEK